MLRLREDVRTNHQVSPHSRHLSSSQVVRDSKTVRLLRLTRRQEDVTGETLHRPDFHLTLQKESLGDRQQEEIRVGDRDSL